MGGPIVVSVVVASRSRPLRLRWLLNALGEQTLGRDRWEAVESRAALWRWLAIDTQAIEPGDAGAHARLYRPLLRPW